jgi:hypothetical protein
VQLALAITITPVIGAIARKCWRSPQLLLGKVGTIAGSYTVVPSTLSLSMSGLPVIAPGAMRKADAGIPFLGSPCETYDQGDCNFQH